VSDRRRVYPDGTGQYVAVSVIADELTPEETGGLFRIAVKLMMAKSTCEDQVCVLGL
jgi:hypothetical protein